MKTSNKWRINRYDFLIIFFSGLIRGPVAFALMLEASDLGIDDPQRVVCHLLPVTTIYLIAVSTVVIAGLLKKITDWSFKKIASSTYYSPEDPTIKETFIKETFIDTR